MTETTDLISETDFPDYTEPIYPLTKVELFDEDNLKHLLSDTRFNKQDRKRLTDYNKHRQSGSQVLVQYKLATGCEEYQLGRLFPTDGIGLQSFRFDIRNPLTKKWYWDTDIENCHYCIAFKWCERFDIPCNNISKYIQNREEILQQVSANRKKAKTELLKILYGGNIKLYNEHYDDVDGEISRDGIKFLFSLRKEVQLLMDKIWEAHPHLWKLKIGGDKTPICKKSNPKASLMSLLFQTDERKLLMFYEYILKTKYNRNIGIFIHDGGEVERIDGETCFPVEIMDDCSRIITEKFRIRCRITQKPIDYNWSPLGRKLSEYETRKAEFEKRNFFVGSQFIHLQDDGVLEFVKINDLRVRLRCNNYWEYNADLDKNVKKYFFDEWLDDPTRANYERIDFIPNRDECPKNVFNLFKGFNAEKYKTSQELTEEEINELVSPILTHFDYLTSGNSSFAIKCLAQIIQDPTNKSQVGILLRDMGGLLGEGGGTGKNLMLDWFGNEIIGEDYYYIVGDNREIYGTFNSQFEGKLFVMVEEASSKENHINHDILKSKITAKKQNVNKKMVASYSVRDYTNYWFCSNNRNPLPIKQGNRRLAVFDTDTTMRGNVEYFKTLSDHLAKPKVKWAFYKYLQSVFTYKSPIDFQNAIPITPAYQEVRILNAPIYLKWIVSVVKNGNLQNGTIRELYAQFKRWIKENREGSEETIISETAFGLLLKKSKEAGLEEEELLNSGIRVKTKGGMIFTWNIDNVVIGLKKLFLLEPDFIYTAIDIPDTDDTDTEESSVISQSTR